MTWDDIFYQAIDNATQYPLFPQIDNNYDLELEIAYYMAQIDEGHAPTLPCIHSYIIQVSLTLAPTRPISPYSNIKKLQRRLIEAGFTFVQGRIFI